jgi:cell division protein FtsA
MKLKYGCAYTENGDIDNNMKYSIDPERQVEVRKFIEIVEGRVEEIIANVWCQVPEEYCDKLLGGIVLTGGGSNMDNIETAFRNYTHVDKIRIAKFVTQTITSNINEINARDGKMNTVLGLLAKGDINCAGEEFDPNGNLFATPKQVQVDAAAEQRRARQATEIPAGVVRTAEEIRRADEEARQRREEEERIAREEAENKAREEARRKKENSFWNKGWGKLKKFGETILGPEEE